jgi:hypothetical protein
MGLSTLRVRSVSEYLAYVTEIGWRKIRHF